MTLNKRRVVAGLLVAIAWSACGQTLQFLNTKVEGDGTIQLKWQSATNGVYSVEYKTALATNISWRTLVDAFPSHGTNTTFLDTGRYWETPELKHPKYDGQRFYRVVQTDTNTLTPPVVTVTNPTTGSVLSGDATITATITSTDRVVSVSFFVDGEDVHTIVVPDSGTVSYVINTTEWPNGSHNIFVVARIASGDETTGVPATVKDGAGASTYIPVTFDNYISKWEFSESIFEASLGETQRITATFVAYSDWTLEILDEFNAAVRTATGSGYTMQFDWNGTGDSNQNLPDGEYQFILTATEATPPAPAPGGGEGGGGPPAPMMAAMAAGESSYFVPPPPMPPVKVKGEWLSWEEVYGPLPLIEVLIPGSLFVNRFTAAAFGGNSPAGPNAPQGGQTTQNPQRPPPKVIKGTPGLVGVGYQGHHPNTTNGIAGFNRPNNLVGLITLSPNYVLPYGKILRAKAIADGFAGAMNKSGWKTAFKYGDDQLTAPLVRKPSKGGSNLFNYCNIGLLIGHGIRGTSQDFLATSTPSLQTYMPIYKSGVNAYDWIRISECSFGGNPAGLRWMGIYACNMLAYPNASDMWNKLVLPMNRNLHILLSAETSVFMYPEFGQRWADYMNGKVNGTKQTVIDSWNFASRDVHTTQPATTTVTMSCLYWPACFNDKLLSYTDNGSTDQSDIRFRRVQVHPTFVIIE